MEKRVITSALPYVNNVPHLGNLIQVLSADVYARFSRLRGNETLYICGTDEFGTATETKAYMENVDPKTLCDTYYTLHAELYEWFQIGFDCFGRTSDPIHAKITQELFKKVYDAGLVYEEEVTQLYSEKSERFLADRYIAGTCPRCQYEEARGDQCEHCGELLDPIDLINPRSLVDDSTPIRRKTKHLYLNLPALSEQLREWVDKTAKTGSWNRNALSMTEGWLREGLKPRAITRDLKWGIPVPLEGYESKVFYVWFDAPIGYISITAQHTDNWQSWWLENDDVKLCQFVGKDNVPFHTIMFPAVLLGSKQPWTMLHSISSTEYMTYEKGMFSKSRGIGIFADDARESSIPAAVWRFYLMLNRPERADYNFSWDNFQQMINMELIGNLSNFVNRVLSFSSRYFDGKLSVVSPEKEFAAEIEKRSNTITELMEQIELRQALREILSMSDYANRLFQHREPWNLRKSNPEEAQNFISMLIYLVRDIAVFITPFLPDIAQTIAGYLNMDKLSWEMLGNYNGIESINRPQVLFSILENDLVNTLQEKFSGKQAENNAKEQNTSPQGAFNTKVRLCSARIDAVEHHPNADKLYVINLDLGDETRTIVSGLVGHYTPEDLIGKTIILVRNLKPAKLRGVESNGMLLAAHSEEELEVLFLDDASLGTDLSLEGMPSSDEPGRINIDVFHSFPLCLDAEGQLSVEKTRILYKDKPVRAQRLQGCGVE